MDKPWLAIDGPNNAIYVSYTVIQYGSSSCTASKQFQIKLARSLNGGAWSSSDVTSLAQNVVQGSNVVVAPNGDVLVVWYDDLGTSVGTASCPVGAGSMAIKFKRSSTQGTSWTSETVVAAHTGTPLTLPGMSWCFWQTMFPKLATGPNTADSSQYNVYAVYAGHGVGSDPSDIFFSKSTNKGDTWLQIDVKLNPGFDNAQFYPSIAIDAGPDNILDDLHVTYADMSIDTSTSPTQYAIKHIQSDNAGGTWLPIQTVSLANSTAATGLNSPGDYFDVATSGGHTIPIWADRRTQDYDIWDAPSDISLIPPPGGGGCTPRFCPDHPQP